MATMFYDADADLELLKGRKIAVVGYGSQGHAHALNLRDSGLDVRVGLYKGSRSWADAEAAGLKVMETSAAAAEADVIMMLVPDQVQKTVYERDIQPHLTEGKTLMFAHGFNIHYSQITPAQQRRCEHGGPQEPGSHDAPGLHRGRRGAGLGGRLPGLQRSGPGSGIGLRQGAGLHPCRCHRDHVR